MAGVSPRTPAAEGRFTRIPSPPVAPPEGVVDALAALADLRDGYSAAHGERLVRWALAAGRALGLEEERLAALAAAARLHDIGKVGVPDRILHKPTRLDEAEWAEVRRHAVLGADVLGRVPALRDAAAILRHHHERWDGSGYPDRLAGEDIPLEARIVGACEALGALLADRPYRPAYDRATAVQVLVAAGGTQFDPRVVDAVITESIADDPLDASLPEAARDLEPPPRGALQPGPSRLVRAFERLEALPASVEARDRLAALVTDERTPFSVCDAAAVIEADLALTVGVLRLANVDRTPKQMLDGVPGAVEAIGPAGVREVLGRVAAVGVFQRIPGWEMTLEQFRLHAVATQRAAEQIARAVGHQGTDMLLVAALLHDAGKLVLATAHVGYPSVVHGTAQRPEDRLLAERRELGVDHAIAGGVMARRWCLPDAVVDIVEHHHDPAAEGDVAIVRLADMLAHHGHGRAVDPRALAAVASSLRFAAGDLRALLHDLPQGAARRRTTTPSPLAKQETAVLRELASGKRYKEVATELGISVSTVRSHASSAFAKLGVPDRAQAVLTATAEGWL